MVEVKRSFNDRLALFITRYVSTMNCAYAFAIIALIALPQAITDSFSDGFRPMPLVTWLSQSFLQLVLLSIVMVGQQLQNKAHGGYHGSHSEKLDKILDHLGVGNERLE